ncbi:hypothetical protein C900_04074 [Fulvivirga imtechensis AK7]|uniref:HTH cro/C1-type domain-containing protein n=1 Tax=Fulvivirga imtechensis AK7 TaxID=1237149 RepID=L8JRT5_9BACT|nr:helix-turn-helix transcriptional regulator [Fulvivirga imtechensis]ELR70077.1 hypothetical protein C900_04074 [Fulvivirga imtechensis AK7]
MLHIGEEIRKVFKESGLTVAEFARRIDTSRENVYGIFKRKSIDTRLLQKISDVLDHNFFKYYVNPEELYPEIASLQRKLEVADQEIAYLKKINKLLEKKK